MKKHLLSIFMLGSLAIIAQTPPAVQWQKSFGGASTDDAYAIQQTSDGGYILAGASSSTNGDITTNQGNNDYWVTKIDSTGSLTWQKSLGGSGDDVARAVIQTADGGYLVAGSSNSSDGDVTGNKGQYDVWLVKLGAGGVVKWKANLGGTGVDQAWWVQQEGDEGYIIAADSRSNNYDLTSNYGSSDAWIVKTDSLGGILWQKSLGGSGTEHAYEIHATPSGYIFCGQTDSNNMDVSGNNGGIDAWAVFITSGGTIQWQKCLGGASNDIAYSIRPTPSDGGFIAGGKTASSIAGNQGYENAWLIKLSSTGTVNWQKCYGGDQFECANSVRQTPDGGYVFSGPASSNSLDVSGNHGSNDYWVVKTFSTGVLDWQKCLGGTGSDIATCVRETADNGYVVAGHSNSTNGDITNAKGQDDYWVVKFKGTVVTQTTTPPPPTGIAEIAANNDRLSVYPNPGKGQITVLVDQPLQAQAGSLQIFTPMGLSIYETDLKQSEVEIDLSGSCAKGIYFLQLRNSAGSVVATKKLLIE